MSTESRNDLNLKLWNGVRDGDYDDIDNSDSDDDYSYDVGINQSQYRISLMSCK